MARKSGFVARFRAGQDGATMVEYALMIAFVAMVCIVAVRALGQAVYGPFQQAVNGLS